MSPSIAARNAGALSVTTSTGSCRVPCTVLPYGAPSSRSRTCQHFSTIEPGSVLPSRLGVGGAGDVGLRVGLTARITVSSLHRELGIVLADVFTGAICERLRLRVPITGSGMQQLSGPWAVVVSSHVCVFICHCCSSVRKVALGEQVSFCPRPLGNVGRVRLHRDTL